MMCKTTPQRAIKMRLNYLSCSTLHLCITSPNLIQFPLQGGDVFGAGECDVQAGRDCIDELHVVLFSC